MTRELQRLVDDGVVKPLSPELVEREVRVMIGVLDGVEDGWSIDPGIDLEGVVRHQIDGAIARWSGRYLDAVRAETDAYLAGRAARARSEKADVGVG